MNNKVDKLKKISIALGPIICLTVWVHSVCAQDISQTERKAKEYLDLGILYQGFFNTAVNSYLNYYSAKLDIISKRKEERDYLYYYRGLCYYYRGDFTKAIKDFQKISRRSNLYFPARIQLGACYYHQKENIDKAKKLWQEIERKNIPELLAILGQLYARLQIEEEKANQYCQKKQDRKAKEGLAILYLNQEKYNKANQMINQIDIRSPDLSYKYQSQGETIVSQFYDPITLWIKSQLYLYKAITLYKQLQNKKPNNLDYTLQLGIAQLLCGKIAKATLTLTPLLNSANLEVKAKALINLGICYYITNLEDKAFECWDKVASEYKDNPQIKSELAYTYARLGGRLEKALPLCTDRPGKFSWHLGLVYFKTEKNCCPLTIRYFEKNHRQECGYQIRYHDPLFLLDMANAYYFNKDFLISTQILNSLYQQRYEDLKGIVENFQKMENAWRFWKDGKIDWKDIWYPKNIRR